MMVGEQIRAGQDPNSICLSIINDDVTLSLVNNVSERLNEIHLKLIFDFLPPAYPKYQSTSIALISRKISQQFPRKWGGNVLFPPGLSIFNDSLPSLGTYCRLSVGLLLTITALRYLSVL